VVGAIKFLWLVNIFTGRGLSEYEKLVLELLHGKKKEVGKQ
jgi:hypothetical protein